MRKLIMLAAVLAGGVPATQAYDYDYLTFQSTTGEQTAVAVENLVLTVADGCLVAANGTETHSFPLSALGKMFFTSTPTAAGSAVAAEGSEVNVYNTSGIHMGQYATEADAAQSQKGGVYIMKSKGETKKIVKP